MEPFELQTMNDHDRGAHSTASELTADENRLNNLKDCSCQAQASGWFQYYPEAKLVPSRDEGGYLHNQLNGGLGRVGEFRSAESCSCVLFRRNLAFFVDILNLTETSLRSAGRAVTGAVSWRPASAQGQKEKVVGGGAQKAKSIAFAQVSMFARVAEDSSWRSACHFVF
jgi:hypothetical protein